MVNIVNFVTSLAIILNSSLLLAQSNYRINQIEATAESLISINNPYIQQTIIYTVKIITRNNVATFSLTPPTVPGAVLELIENKPRTYGRITKNGQMIINEYHYALTPLIDGNIEVPPTQIFGELAGISDNKNQTTLNNNSFEVRSNAINFQARAMPTNASYPWLPIQALALVNGNITREAHIGEPFSLSLWLRAIGVRGQRLPLLNDLLQGANFRIYPEKAVEYWQDISADGKLIRGQRHETLSVIPLTAGILQLPKIKISWWDTTTDKPMTLEWETPEIKVNNVTNSAYSWEAWRWLLFLFVALIFLLIGWWIGAAQSKQLALIEIFSKIDLVWQKIKNPLSNYILKFKQYLLSNFRFRFVAAKITNFSPAQENNLFNAVKKLVYLQILPNTFHTRRLLYQIQIANHAETLRQALQVYALNYLKLTAHCPLIIIAAEIIKIYPKLANSTILDLFHQLDSALYGIDNSLTKFNLENWKQEFKKIIYLLSKQPKQNTASNKYKLPVLNFNNDL